MAYELEEVGKDVDNLKKVVAEIVKSDKEQSGILNDMKTSIAVIETNIINMKESFDGIGKTLAWGGAGLGLLISIAVIINAVL